MNNLLSNGKDRFKSGLSLASNSFSLLWQHPILLVYLAVSIGLYLVIQTISYNTASYDLSFTTGITNVGPLFDLSRWHHYLLLLIFTFGYVYVSTLLTVCLISHVNHFLRYEHVSILDNIYPVRKKLRITFYWSLIITALAYLIQLLSSHVATPQQFFNPYMIFISLLGITWSFLTFIVVPIITLEKVTIGQALIKSKDIVFSLFIEIIAGVFWIALIAILVSMPFVIPLVLKMNVQIPGLLILVSTCCIMLIALVISTVQAIFKTILYNYYTKPIEELEKLKYPRF